MSIEFVCTQTFLVWQFKRWFDLFPPSKLQNSIQTSFMNNSQQYSHQLYQLHITFYCPINYIKFTFILNIWNELNKNKQNAAFLSGGDCFRVWNFLHEILHAHMSTTYNFHNLHLSNSNCEGFLKMPITFFCLWYFI